MKSKILQKISLTTLPFICAGIMKLWFSTCRVTVHGQEIREKVTAKKDPIIATFWHYGIIGYFYVLRNESSVVLVSASDDGEYIARLAGHLGLTAVRGSRNKRGMQALKELLRKIRQGNNIGIVADGSRGPAKVAQPGAVLLASKTGGVIMPIMWSASKYYTVNSWDRTILPKLFSRIDFHYGEPLVVPKNLDAKGIEEYREKMETHLNNLYVEAWMGQGKHEH